MLPAEGTALGAELASTLGAWLGTGDRDGMTLEEADGTMLGAAEGAAVS